MTYKSYVRDASLAPILCRNPRQLLPALTPGGRATRWRVAVPAGVPALTAWVGGQPRTLTVMPGQRLELVAVESLPTVPSFPAVLDVETQPFGPHAELLIRPPAMVLSSYPNRRMTLSARVLSDKHAARHLGPTPEAQFREQRALAMVGVMPGTGWSP